MSNLSLETIHAEGSVRIALEGELDFNSALILDDELRRAEADQMPVLVLDLSRLRFMDSTGLAIIASACRRMRRRDRRLIVAYPTKAVRRIFQLTGMLERLEVVDGPAAAPA
jgi:anti-sigma B factor antagonist/stage II sporulation protein AA (anti-sigma F factor antagonist)